MLQKLLVVLTSTLLLIPASFAGNFTQAQNGVSGVAERVAQEKQNTKKETQKSRIQTVSRYRCALNKLIDVQRSLAEELVEAKNNYNDYITLANSPEVQATLKRAGYTNAQDYVDDTQSEVQRLYSEITELSQCTRSIRSTLLDFGLTGLVGHTDSVNCNRVHVTCAGVKY